MSSALSTSSKRRLNTAESEARGEESDADSVSSLPNVVEEADLDTLGLAVLPLLPTVPAPDNINAEGTTDDISQAGRIKSYERVTFRNSLLLQMKQQNVSASFLDTLRAGLTTPGHPKASRVAKDLTSFIGSKAGGTLAKTLGVSGIQNTTWDSVSQVARSLLPPLVPLNAGPVVFLDQNIPHLYHAGRYSSNWATVEDILQKYLSQGKTYKQAKVLAQNELNSGFAQGPLFNQVSSATTSCLRDSGLYPSEHVTYLDRQYFLHSVSASGQQPQSRFGDQFGKAYTFVDSLDLLLWLKYGGTLDCVGSAEVWSQMKITLKALKDVGILEFRPLCFSFDDVVNVEGLLLHYVEKNQHAILFKAYGPTIRIYENTWWTIKAAQDYAILCFRSLLDEVCTGPVLPAQASAARNATAMYTANGRTTRLAPWIPWLSKAIAEDRNVSLATLMADNSIHTRFLLAYADMEETALSALAKSEPEASWGIGRLVNAHIRSKADAMNTHIEAVRTHLRLSEGSTTTITSAVQHLVQTLLFQSVREQATFADLSDEDFVIKLVSCMTREGQTSARKLENEYVSIWREWSRSKASKPWSVESSAMALDKLYSYRSYNLHRISVSDTTTVEKLLYAVLGLITRRQNSRVYKKANKKPKQDPKKTQASTDKQLAKVRICHVVDCGSVKSEMWLYNDKVCKKCHTWAHNHNVSASLFEAFVGEDAPMSWTKPAETTVDEVKRCQLIGCTGTKARNSWHYKGQVCPTCYKACQNAKVTPALKIAMASNSSFRKPSK